MEDVNGEKMSFVLLTILGERADFVNVLEEDHQIKLYIQRGGFKSVVNKPYFIELVNVCGGKSASFLSAMTIEEVFG